MIRMPGESYRGVLPPLTGEQAALGDELRQNVEALAGRIGERNLLRYGNLVAAGELVERLLTESGYAVERQEYIVEGRTCVNLAAEIPGADRRREIVVVGGHYDSVVSSPGANDNATGVAATLALARALSDFRPSRTLRFLCFVNEEPPFFQTANMGSRVYAKRCRQRGEDIRAMVCLETIGYYSDEKGSQHYPPPLGLLYPTTGDFIAFVGNYGSRRLVRQVVGSFRRHARFPSEGGAVPGVIPGIGWSDHWAFWKEGYPALMVTDTAPFRYPHYHQATDTPDKIDYERMARVVSGVEAVVRDLAGAAD
jgi:Zn-dependent M28 family amino/carboxypeptidase